MDTLAPVQENKADYRSLFEAQRRRAPQMAATTAQERIARLKRIQTWVMDHLADIEKAMYDDFRKPSAEVLMGEVYSLNGEIKHAVKHLKSWMKPQRVPTPLSLVGTVGYVHYEPKGVILIISPAVKPLISAIAAGNTAIIKPSEMTPNTSGLLRKMMAELFSADEVTVVEGGVPVSQALLELPFDHIFFTGSPAVGKIVMAAAARNLTSVTLELGGKSPCIVDQTADLKTTARIVAWGKCLNNGQTCIAPDYLFVHQSIKDAFVQEYGKAIRDMYDAEGRGVEASDSYARLVNRHHFQRVKKLLDDAVSKGARISLGGRTNEADNFVEPTLVENVTEDMSIMQEEIFGPLLPILTYDDREEVVRFIRRGEKPLALYVNSRNENNIRFFLENTSAGDSVVNDVLLQFGNPELPFGGVNNSGIGKSNGIFGFQEFSNAKGVMRRQFGTMKFIYPPYTDKVRKLIGYLVKYL